jgi:hypothetical protein
MYLTGDRLYALVDKTLLVYSEHDLSSPLATLSLSDFCTSAIMIDNRLFLAGTFKLHVH